MGPSTPTDANSFAGKEGKPELVIPRISQETLAEMVGTTRSRVSFFMNRFRKLGFIDYDGGSGLQVHSSPWITYCCYTKQWGGYHLLLFQVF